MSIGGFEKNRFEKKMALKKTIWKKSSSGLEKSYVVFLLLFWEFLGGKEVEVETEIEYRSKIKMKK